MGSLTKKPKTPPVQQFINPAPVVSSTPVTEPSEPSPSEEDIRNEVRQESLLRRSRGRLGTVFTGFRGLLSEIDSSDQSSSRKTLLGE